MLNIMIVDDEVLIREGLAKIIGKESPCFRVVGQFPDGEDALRHLPELEVDVVITDIRMPVIDGLELIKSLRATHPHIRSILMSGFTEFEYAREAIRVSAVDYLLKPINKEQLFELLYRLHDEQETSREKEALHRQRLIHTCLHSEAVAEYVWEELSLPRPYFVAFVQRAGTEESEHTQTCGRSLDNFDPEWLFDRLAVQHRLQVFIFYFAEAPGADAVHRIGKLLTGDAFHGGADGRVHAGSSNVYNDVKKLKAAYLEAKLACDTGIYGHALRHYAPYGAIGDRTSPPQVQEITAAEWEFFTEQLHLLHLAPLQEWIQRRFERLRSEAASPEAIVETCTTIEEAAAAEIRELKDIFESPAYAGRKERLLACLSFSEMKQLFLSCFMGALSELQKARKEMGSKAVETVKRWIAENYSRHVELNTLANLVFLTPSYLSKLFKHETGLTLTEYIAEIRLKNAKRLLRTEPGMKVHQIGAEVGYPDPAYFNKLFKKMVGVTPNEYKKML
ncbi:response regulator [Paenibacillus sp. VCA1]|uniref:response regulator n=1 Tax=Paenibacillus sp. VCA1 TaxID=3039148 RepID=UPI0028723CDE|nr:response regulator [Paenibacillus sp. VCA1]MDR9852134.1 response regulator [Paenibacillus sp. VCA1]